MVNNFIYSILFFSIGFAAWIQNPSPMLTRSFNAKSTSLAGINSFDSNKLSSIQFSYSYSPDNFFKEGSIIFEKDFKKYYLSYFGIDDLEDTDDAWHDNGDGIPTSNEIDYSKITTFNYNSISFACPMRLSRLIDNNFNLLNIEIWPVLSISKMGLESSYLGSLTLSNKLEYKNSEFKFFLHDLLSINWWSTSQKEIYHPFIQLIGKFSFSRAKILFDGLIKKNNIKARLGIDIQIHKNLFLRSGIRSNENYSFGIGIKNSFIETDLAVLPLDYSNPFTSTQQFSLKLFLDKTLTYSKRFNP